MKPPSLQLDHLALPIHDVEASHRFYTDVLGLPLVDAFSGDDWGGRAWLMMVFALGDGRQIALCALRGARRPAEGDLPRDIRHFAFSVASSDELAGWGRRLRDHGIAFDEEDHGTQRSLYFEDPNGIVFEVTTPPSAAVTTVDPAAGALVAAWARESA